MPFDFKKEYKEFYMPPKKPMIVDIPEMSFLAVRGKGNPNEPDGAYSKALGLLYGMAYTIKMSDRGPYKMEGFFKYVVPPLEGFWWQDEAGDFNAANKEKFNWISLIRLPDFVKQSDFDWAVTEAARKKKLDFSSVEFFTHKEGLCVQSMHMGSFDHEAATILEMDRYALEHGYETDITAERFHHEIYLNDARKCAADKLKTVIRHPIKKAADHTL